MSSNNPYYAARQYLKNLADGTYGKVGTKITITNAMQDYVDTALTQWDFWRNRTTEVVEENMQLQKENRDMRQRLLKVTKVEEVVRLLQEISKDD